QEDRSLERSQGGLGIGLTIVRKLVEMHGGSITASSAGPGRGSEFVVRLPGADAAAQRKAGSAGPTTARPEAGRRVLVVDDNVDGAESIGMLLKVHGHQVQLAYNGPEALRAAERFLPQVIILDIGLPGMNGYEVAKRLRQQPEFRSAMLVAVTG